MYQDFYNRIKEAKFVAVVTHTRPDGDTVGSSLGLHHALEFNGVKSVVVCGDDIGRKLHFLPGFKNIKKEIPKSCDLVISVDTAIKKRVSTDTRDLEILVIDHHISNPGFGSLNIIEPEYTSTGEVVYKFLKKCDLKINKPSAKALHTAIVSDSRSFSTPRVNAETFEATADLIRCGADNVETMENLYLSKGLSEMRLFGEVLREFEVVCNGEVTLCVVTKEILERCGAEYSDTEDIADFLLGNVTAKATCLLIERKNGGTKGSLRSKGPFDVNQIAGKLGGGGHKNAAGFESEVSPNEYKKKVIEVLTSGV
ncbi:MAG: bifunctional oligoribonuclease/PAP phosphatase NrnA [Campylobacterales bacterium]|nr:bifunctional oligoribonuclease/PAP phosphatase NrnA [Campylobacterales bacterium]